ncbi:hypothetical protein AS850_13760 [Frondihabitans sp. 762G35]|uniref:glycosyltransferase n=1 Tax=Frondihabitans sp. 762G35 TaxID=1446794 RepID=UPI000D2167C6|nr:glycosyltransferase [Frondihabitans sp. 762G35]ARC58145.1 hypothetical protein AS850_13760 [Frondihabitans sp. 762G35]
MKIALFTPVTATSAIARVSALVRGALEAESHEVVVVATEDVRVAAGAARDDLADALDWRDQTAVRDLLWTADTVVHQVGNHFGFHSGSVFWIPLIGGTVVLHDFFLGDLFLLWAEENSDAADRILRRLRGTTIADFRAIAHSGRFAELGWPDLAMTDWLTESADAVVAHSDFGLAPVTRVTDAPVRVLPLPYALASATAPASVSAGAAAPETGDRLRLLTFGHIIPNKLCEDVIAAVSASPLLRGRVDYRICGEISDDYRGRLQSFADDIGVSVAITGALSDADLADELRLADVIACVRRPTLESGSATAVESLLSGTPLVVLAEGFYASLPGDVVFSLPPDDFQAALTRTLRSIVLGEVNLPARAEAGRRYAERTFRADGYATELVALAPLAAEHRILREMDATFVDLRTGPPAVAAEYERDTAIFRA